MSKAELQATTGRVGLQHESVQCGYRCHNVSLSESQISVHDYSECGQSCDLRSVHFVEKVVTSSINAVAAVRQNRAAGIPGLSPHTRSTLMATINPQGRRYELTDQIQGRSSADWTSSKTGKAQNKRTVHRVLWENEMADLHLADYCCPMAVDL